MSLENHDNSTPKSMKQKVPMHTTNTTSTSRNPAEAIDQSISTMPDRSTDQADANRDPISGEPGAHPVGTGMGAAGVGSVATVVGSVVGGPIGAVVGAVVGSVVGGLAGKSTAEKINPTVEDSHWRENYSSRPYVKEGATYEEYQYAYRVGYEGYDRYGDTGRNYSDVEPNLQREYEANQQGNLTWEKAKHAVKDAWDRAAASVNP
jgi:hypothetical protein